MVSESRGSWEMQLHLCMCCKCNVHLGTQGVKGYLHTGIISNILEIKFTAFH